MIELRKIEWSDIVEKHLEKCQGEGWTLEDMKLEVKVGYVDLLGVFVSDKFLAVMILRNEFPELVIVGAGGLTFETSTYRHILPYVREYAKENGFKTLRAHALDNIRARALQIAGWNPVEHIFKIKVA